jgi:hypothetical protein
MQLPEGRIKLIFRVNEIVESNENCTQYYVIFLFLIRPKFLFLKHLNFYRQEL